MDSTMIEWWCRICTVGVFSDVFLALSIQTRSEVRPVRPVSFSSTFASSSHRGARDDDDCELGGIS